MLTITALPAFNDNYIWLLQNPATQHCAVVDPGDATPVLDWLGSNPQWQLTDILITHHHRDHTGGIDTLKQATSATVYGPQLETIAGVDQLLEDGQQLQVLGHAFNVLHVPGHTLGHIAYYMASPQPILFCGDTLFLAGCGRMFEGSPEQMHASLQRLAALPAQTLVYCTHEYSLSNLKFAAAVEPDNSAIGQRTQEVTKLREQSLISLPSTIAHELATNPFLRCEVSTVIASAAREGQLAANADSVAVFAALRAWKDRF